MKVPKRTMIGTVLSTTVKTILVGTFVRVRQLVVEPIVRAVLARRKSEHRANLIRVLRCDFEDERR